MQKSKMAIWGSLTNSCEEKRKAKEKRKDNNHLNAEFQRIARRDKNAFLSDQYKETEENNRMGKTRDLFTEKAMAPHSSTLAWKIPWAEEPGRLLSMGSQESDPTKAHYSRGYGFSSGHVWMQELNHKEG